MTMKNPDSAAVSAPERAHFLAMAARYEVSDDARHSDLLNDVGCLLNCAYETVNTLAHGLSDSGSDIAVNSGSAASVLFGVGYLIKMADGATSAAYSRGGLATSTDTELLGELRRRGLVATTQGGAE